VKRREGLAALLAAMAPAAQGRTLRVQRGDRLQDAVAAARDGDVVELEGGEHQGQTAVITQQRLTLRAATGTAVLHADGAHAEGKALVVVRGGRVHIEGIEFRGTRVPHGNGAGIRFERGALTLHRCRFFDNEMGLLAADVAASELTIQDCDFGQAPRHEGLLHHLLYVGRIGSLRLTGSRLSGGWRGHLVKSRAAVSRILCNRLIDGDEGEASYEIDLPNGGFARVQGNVVAQGPRPQNAALVAFGAEGNPHAASHLVMTHNHLLNDAEAPAAFVRHWPERLPADATLRLEDNLFVGHAVEGSWGRPEDGNLLLPPAERARALLPPPCAGA
jgi:hypothetical protein